MAALICNLDQIKGEEKTLILGGKSFDFTLIPFEITLDFLAMAPELQKLGGQDAPTKEIYGRVLDLVLRIMQSVQPGDESITKEWLIKQINMDRVPALMDFLTGALVNSKKNEAPEDEGEISR
jgi:hypothetical protein